MADKSYTVKLKPGHPAGMFRRSGKEFTTAPVTISQADFKTPAELDAVLHDNWLDVKEIGATGQTGPAAMPATITDSAGQQQQAAAEGLPAGAKAGGGGGSEAEGGTTKTSGTGRNR